MAGHRCSSKESKTIMRNTDLSSGSRPTRFISMILCSTMSYSSGPAFAAPMPTSDTQEGRGSKVRKESCLFENSREVAHHAPPDIFALVGTHEGHKLIRDVVESLYAKVGEQEPQVFRCVQKFCKRLSAERDNNRPVNLSHACLSLAIGSSPFFLSSVTSS